MNLRLIVAWRVWLLVPMAVLLGAADPISLPPASTGPAPATTAATPVASPSATVAPALTPPVVVIRVGDTNFYQGLTNGTDEPAQFGGKVDALLTADLGRLGLWTGLSLTSHGEYNYGQGANVNYEGGTVLPVNTALTFPGTGGEGADVSSLFLSQRFGTTATLSLGKINMLDQAANTPLRGGGGIDTFQNIGLAAPVTGLVPPYLYGVIGSVRTKSVIVTLIVFDPESAVRAGPEHLFQNGVNVLASVTLPITLFGRPGYQGVKFVESSKQSVDLRDVPQLILPSDTPPVLRGPRSPWFFSYSIQQFLVVDKTDPSRGWGIFGEAGFSDGNPTPIGHSEYVGIGGSSLLHQRAQDRFGIGYFSYSLSRELQDILAPVGRVRSESGVEAFYNANVFRWLNVSGDVQAIEPALPGQQTAVFLGVRARIGF
jgi:porin